MVFFNLLFLQDLTLLKHLEVHCICGGGSHGFPTLWLFTPPSMSNRKASSTSPLLVVDILENYKYNLKKIVGYK